MLILHLIVIIVDSTVNLNGFTVPPVLFIAVTISFITILLCCLVNKGQFYIGFLLNFVLSLISLLLVPFLRGDMNNPEAYLGDGYWLSGTQLYLVAFAACNSFEVLMLPFILFVVVRNIFLVFIRIRRIGTGSHPYKKKLCRASYYIQLSTNIKMYKDKVASAQSSFRTK